MLAVLFPERVVLQHLMPALRDFGMRTQTSFSLLQISSYLIWSFSRTLVGDAAPTWFVELVRAVFPWQLSTLGITRSIAQTGLLSLAQAAGSSERIAQLLSTNASHEAGDGSTIVAGLIEFMNAQKEVRRHTERLLTLFESLKPFEACSVARLLTESTLTASGELMP
jgi:hypothetical protein